MTDIVTATPKTFANNFWGKDDLGYDVLTQKMNNAKKTFEELKAFYNVRASLHEEYGKKLLKHLKSGLGKEETGTLKVLLASAHKELEITAQANLELGQKIRTILELSLDNFILEQKDRRKLVQTNVDKAHRNKQLHTSHVARAKEKYESECAKKITLEGQLASASLREAERLRQKIDRCTHEIATLELEYKNACLKLADATAIWKAEWKIACDRYQEMEEKRVEFLHHSLSLYVNILSTALGKDQESYDRFWKSLDQCDARKDIDIFIETKGTGPMIPEAPEYVHYMDDPAKTLPKYSIAQFPDMDTLQNCEPVDTPHPPPPSKEPAAVINNVVRSRSSTRKSKPNEASPPSTKVKRVPTVTHSVKRIPTVTSKESSPRRKSVERTSLVSHAPDGYIKEAPKAYPCDSPSDDELDEPIDPRAKVVFAIGNNMFDVDHQKGSKLQAANTTRKPNGLDEAFNISIKDLLEELGVYNSSNDPQPTVSRRKSKSDTQMGRPSKIADRRASLIQGDSVSRQPSAKAVTNDIQGSAVPFAPPITAADLQTQGHHIIGWARALYDYRAEQAHDLSYTRGTWFAITRTNPNGWWWAYPWDEMTGDLSGTSGYVASNLLELVA
ncbi:uncharacterized protein BYT42DRAFT_575308 [Radiomyces spectabilis]|uniref:uncharacterized protein n=1 Tax=Radiomyces spectabilis TaxID=64574 RepID=UPI00221FF1D0|nr:uncharacterized protein BYT42DRAFT_575308 [Radiomyces spectabilis]KAI8374153.1 hypothetical protein BYT42DRAFT_575308 [Radiomyces spectabilis]